jgi:pimeloyl-ACP methyl ester carboxylesterase
MLSYDVAGTGPPLVLLHSTVCDRRMWDPQWPVLAEAGYRVVRCDFRGYGETPVPQGPHDDARDVLDLAGELGVGPVAVAGASDIAGAVELNVATWLGPQASQATRERVRLMQRRAFEVQLAAPEQDEPADVAVDLGAITAPSLIVSGGKDLPDFRLIAARLAALLPGTRPVELPWAGHLPTLERPQELSAMLTAFLRDTVPAG